jgi:hypothetical protein
MMVNFSQDPNDFGKCLQAVAMLTSFDVHAVIVSESESIPEPQS